MNEYDEFIKTIVPDPGPWHAARLRYFRGDFAGALKIAEATLAVESSCDFGSPRRNQMGMAKAMEFLGECYFALGRDAGAERAYTESIDFFPRPWSALGLARIALSHRNRRLASKARRVLESRPEWFADEFPFPDDVDLADLRELARAAPSCRARSAGRRPARAKAKYRK